MPPPLKGKDNLSDFSLLPSVSPSVCVEKTQNLHTLSLTSPFWRSSKRRTERPRKQEAGKRKKMYHQNPEAAACFDPNSQPGGTGDNGFAQSDNPFTPSLIMMDEVSQHHQSPNSNEEGRRTSPSSDNSTAASQPPSFQQHGALLLQY
ncbi:hypothetical protein Nepgr_024177 [Nepenthes gracilis]|uniref:Uncharacterized protein n=1 Tax=Nepenthes gracilis TaxID=150966 RepID=A0AAD3XZS9_NEPGR|nr:hypothetical protein Nepgr_024177 [Nepenthes gracilis]